MERVLEAGIVRLGVSCTRHGTEVFEGRGGGERPETLFVHIAVPGK